MTSQLIQSLMKYGPTGVAVIAMLVGWQVLRSEQQRKGDVRRGIITMFCIQCTLMIMMVASSLWRESSNAEKAALLAQVGSLKDENQQQVHQIRAHKDSLGTIQQQLSASIREKEDATREIARLTDRITIADKRENAQRIELARVSGELTQTAERAQALSSQNEQLRKEVADLMSAVNAERNRSDTLQEELIRARAEVTALASAGIVKTASEQRYSCEQELPIGHAFVDKLTGVSLGVSRMGSFGLTSDVIFEGSVTLPTGTNDRFIIGRPGQSWKYRWNERDFVIVLSVGKQPKTFKATVQETTAFLQPPSLP